MMFNDSYVFHIGRVVKPDVLSVRLLVGDVANILATRGHSLEWYVIMNCYRMQVR